MQLQPQNNILLQTYSILPYTQTDYLIMYSLHLSGSCLYRWSWLCC